MSLFICNVLVFVLLVSASTPAHSSNEFFTCVDYNLQERWYQRVLYDDTVDRISGKKSSEEKHPAIVEFESRETSRAARNLRLNVVRDQVYRSIIESDQYMQWSTGKLSKEAAKDFEEKLFRAARLVLEAGEDHIVVGTTETGQRAIFIDLTAKKQGAIGESLLGVANSLGVDVKKYRISFVPEETGFNREAAFVNRNGGKTIPGLENSGNRISLPADTFGLIEPSDTVWHEFAHAKLDQDGFYGDLRPYHAEIRGLQMASHYEGPYSTFMNFSELSVRSVELNKQIKRLKLQKGFLGDKVERKKVVKKIQDTSKLGNDLATRAYSETVFALKNLSEIKHSKKLFKESKVEFKIQKDLSGRVFGVVTFKNGNYDLDIHYFDKREIEMIRPLSEAFEKHLNGNLTEGTLEHQRLLNYQSQLLNQVESRMNSMKYNFVLIKDSYSTILKAANKYDTAQNTNNFQVLEEKIHNLHAFVSRSYLPKGDSLTLGESGK